MHIPNSINSYIRILYVEIKTSTRCVSMNLLNRKSKIKETMSPGTRQAIDEAIFEGGVYHYKL